MKGCDVKIVSMQNCKFVERFYKESEFFFKFRIFPVNDVLRSTDDSQLHFRVQFFNLESKELSIILPQFQTSCKYWVGQDPVLLSPLRTVTIPFCSSPICITICCWKEIGHD